MDRVTKLDRKIGNGCTEPLLGMVEAGDESILSVIKTKDNIQGVLTVINELICYHLANALGLKMPRSGVAHIGEECNVADDLISQGDYGSCFYSEYLKSALLNPGVLSSVKNPEIFQEIIIFDHITYNSDRNLGNLLLTSNKGDKILFAIDHTHVFKNQTLWDCQCLNRGIQENDYLDTKIIEYNNVIYSMFFGYKSIGINELKSVADRYQEIITRDLLDDIIIMIPNDWSINDNDVTALKDYILYRVAHLDDICNMIINYKDGGEIL